MSFRRNHHRQRDNTRYFKNRKFKTAFNWPIIVGSECKELKAQNISNKELNISWIFMVLDSDIRSNNVRCHHHANAPTQMRNVFHRTQDIKTQQTNDYKKNGTHQQYNVG